MSGKAVRIAGRLDADQVGNAEDDTEEQEKISSSDIVVQYINSGIMDGRIVPGQRLIESDLTRVLKVSRGPVREAFRRLDALGILSRALHRGAYVRNLQRFEAVDLLTATEPLVGLIAKLAAEAAASMPKSAAGAMRKALKPYLDRLEDTANLLDQRRHFYEVLIRIGGNSQLDSVLPGLRIHLLRLQIQSALDNENRIKHLQHYSAIATAVVAGDAKKAEKLAREHIRDLCDVVRAMPDGIFAVA